MNPGREAKNFLLGLIAGVFLLLGTISQTVSGIFPPLRLLAFIVESSFRFVPDVFVFFIGPLIVNSLAVLFYWGIFKYKSILNGSAIGFRSDLISFIVGLIFADVAYVGFMLYVAAHLFDHFSPL